MNEIDERAALAQDIMDNLIDYDFYCHYIRVLNISAEPIIIKVENIDYRIRNGENYNIEINKNLCGSNLSDIRHLVEEKRIRAIVFGIRNGQQYFKYF